jgi:hypothetical protein
MEWTIKPPRDVNHNPEAIVDGATGKAPIAIDAIVGRPVVLDASASKDADGHALTFEWFYYPEAGTGIPKQPVLDAGPPPIGGGGSQHEGGIPSSPDGPPEPAPRAIVQSANGPVATVLPNAAGTAHIILAVVDNGSPSLTAYRRIILRIRRAP